MKFTLLYRQGSFAKVESYSSLLGAIARAYAMIDTEGCSGFTIQESGQVVMSDTQILAECVAAKSLLQTGRMPQRAQ